MNERDLFWDFCFMLLSVWIYAYHVCSARGDQEVASDPLGLELQIVRSDHVSAENGIQVLWRSLQYT